MFVRYLFPGAYKLFLGTDADRDRGLDYIGAHLHM